jgi:hypothetical protein
MDRGKLEIVEAYELAEWMKNDPKSLCIIDVRDSDYLRGSVCVIKM